MADGRIYAVLTGDIVASSRVQLITEEPLSLLLEGTGTLLRGLFQGVIHGSLDIFRGDSWQLVLNEHTMAIRVGIYLRAHLRALYGIDSRVAIGFGEINYLPQENVSTGTGQAYTLSGQGLDEITKTVRMNLIMPRLKGTQEGLGIKVITNLIDLQVSRWTQSQSQAVCGALTDQTQTQIAANWQPAPVSQQAISQHLENAGWSQVKNALLFLEDVLAEVLISHP